MKNTCCVPRCESRRQSVVLHRIPKTEIGLKWVLNINCPKLKDLSLEELHKLFVCQKHFEKRFQTTSFRLHIGAVPTLFTNVEMDTGMPSTQHESYENLNVLGDHNYTQTRKRRHEDHSYYKPQPLQELQLAKENLNVLGEHGNKQTRKRSHEDHSYNKPQPLQELQLAKENLILDEHDYTQTRKKSHEDDSYHKPQPLQEIRLAKDNNTPSTSKLCKTSGQNNIVQFQDISEAPTHTSISIPKKTTMTRFVIKKKILTQRHQRILKEFEKAKKQLNFATRAKRAVKFAKRKYFEEITRKLNPLARKILWSQIMQCTKKQKGRRFSDDEKVIALSIMKQSPKSYKFLRRIFILPSIRTLNRMTNKLQVEAGVNPHIFDLIKKEVEDWQESKKYCSVAFDEVALEPGLSYNKHKDNICGLVELEAKTNDYADHALVFMLRGALHKWQQPICYYFCEGATSAQTLKTILKKVITEVTKTGLIPVALVSDQGTAFQSAINKLKENTRRKQILAEEHIDETIEINGHKISVIYDPPHLIKGLRNNFLTKNIKLNDKISKWSDIVDVYLTDCKHSEMRLLHKLNDEHVIPQKIKKMKVKNCTRVLSKTVASALAYTSQFSHYADGKQVSTTLKNTSETVSFFDDLFDSCNGTAMNVKNKGKPLKQAVTNTSNHEVFWKISIKKLEEMRFVNNEGKEIAVPSQKNFVTTLKSMLRLWHFFKEKGYKIMRPRYFNSDPIENFFGQIRAYSFRNNDPNCQAFKNIYRSLLITRFINFHSQSYNCEETSGDQILKLKHFFEAAMEHKGEIQVTSCEAIASPEETENIQAEARMERLNVHSRAYTAGWVVRKCINKINCEDCKKCLTQTTESSIHKWISHREYKDFKTRQKLTYPSEYAVRHFSSIVKETNEYLESKPNSNRISKEISNNIRSKYSFDFLKCQIHKQALLEYFLSTTIKLTVINWCNTINKILKGVDLIRITKQLPYMQTKALNKYKKKLKNKKLNK